MHLCIPVINFTLYEKLFECIKLFNYWICIVTQSHHTSLLQTNVFLLFFECQFENKFDPKIFRFIPRPSCGRPYSPFWIFWILQFLQISNPSFAHNLLKVPRELVFSKKDGSFIASSFCSTESIDFGRGWVLYRAKANDLWSSKILL